MSLLKEFRELEGKSDSYYYDNMVLIKPITNPNEAWTFIERYFEAGEKKSALMDHDIDLLKKQGSTYILFQCTSWEY